MQIRWLSDARAASEMIGPVLLIGVVLTGALLVAALGASTISDTRDDQESKSAKVLMQEVDSRLSTLTTSSAATIAEFTFGDKLGGDPSVVTGGGFLNVTINQNSACSVSIPLDSVRIDTERTTVAYEAGGTWIRSPGNGTAMQTAPNVNYRNGSLDISVTNITGRVGTGVNTAELKIDSSQARTNAIRNTLFQGECVRPDNVTLSVRSDYHVAWSNYLASETGLQEDGSRPDGYSNHSYYPERETVEVFLNQSALPQRTNDSANNVVDVTGADYMESVSVSDAGITVDKDAGNTYSVFAEPISEQVEIGTVRRITEAKNVSRPPLDVVFVIDESGSMGDSAGSETKREAAQNAMKQFTTFLDSDIDRVGLVGFNGSENSRYLRTNNRLLTTDFETFNDTTVESTIADGGTDTSGGMNKATSLLDLQSNESRNRIVVLLSDGRNDYEDWWVNDMQFYCDNDPGYRNYDCYNYHPSYGINGETLYQTNAATAVMAENASRTGMETYTVGFGDRGNISEVFLNGTATAGDGDYFFAENADDLRDVFSSIAKRVSDTEQVGRYPVSTNLTAGGTVHAPQITGDTESLGTATVGGTEFLNVNDPTAPSAFSHAFAVSGGDTVEFNATRFGCEEWAATGQVETINGSQYPVTRCTNIDESDRTAVGKENVTVFTNDDTATFNDFLDNTTTAEWQHNLTDALDQYGDLYNQSSGQLTLDSNRVLVLYDFPDGRNTHNRMLMLYRIGLSEENARPKGVVDIDVNDIEIDADG